MSKTWPISKYLDYLSKRRERGDMSEQQYLELTEKVIENQEAAKPRNKYGAQAQVVDGVRYDSKTELVVYNLCKKLKVPFEFQHRIEIGKAFSYLPGNEVRARSAKWDFSYQTPAGWVLMDCKGMKKLSEGFSYRVYLTKSTYRKKKAKDRPRLYVVYKGSEMAWVVAMKEVYEKKSLIPISRWMV